MSKATTVLATVLIIGAISGGIYFLQDSFGGNLQGQLSTTNLETTNASDEPTTTPNETATETDNTSTPDITGEVKVETPQLPNGDLKVEIVIRNNGEGYLPAETPLQYAIFLNDQEVFSNSSAYTSLAPGESFSFTYPIARTIYQYPDSGIVRLEIDSDNLLQESDKTNNSIEINYSF
ncbi:hypothetical protein CVV38_02825 [Candidatus Peregrinibacteria bacterium HGW-Peregrinibacteria-1]|jgi:hypothetical protein|nr:MAG: hypothetical protein CVV38_02825 [Candidatus Peregrinibacteria bacterium HGW-Peregrinibacteria-1]